MRSVKTPRPRMIGTRFAFGLWLALAGAGKAVVHGETTVLENARIALSVDNQLGAIRTIRDKELNVTYGIAGISFALETERGSVRGLTPASVNLVNENLTFGFETDDFIIALHYRLGAGDRFIEKWLDLTVKDGQPLLLQNVTLEDGVLGPEFKEIHFHDDNTIWQCPINLFLRAENGGCFAGLEYPYWEMNSEGSTGFRLGFKPNDRLAAGETFVSEKYFLGVFRREGIHRYSQGPYPGRVSTPYVNWSGTAGLSQHFKDGVIPAEAVSAEILDWGEVWAMQALMRHVLPDDLPLPEEGFWIWQNGWWAGLYEPNTAVLDQLKQAGIKDVMTAHTWYGRGNHPVPPPYLTKMRIDPMGFPKDDGLAGMPGPAGPAAGLHVPTGTEVVLDQFIAGEYTTNFLAPPAMEAFVQYGQSNGVHVSSFSVPCFFFDERPEWASIDADGNVSEYLFGRKVSCPAVDAYMDHMLNLLDHVFTRYQPRWWGFDGRWLSYWEVAKYRPGTKGLGFDTCHATDHGHLPGDNLYREWKNIQNLLRELRRRHPGVCLEGYYGLKRGGPWALRYLNADENYYETNGAIMNRFQTWHNQNDRFRPVYKNYAALFGGSPAAFRTSLLTSISATSYCQVGPAYADLAVQENRDFLLQWRAWATTNHACLKVKRDLFDCPGFQRLDGSAHIIGDRGFLFLFPSGSGLTPRAVVPMNRWIGLDEDPAALYRITEVFPQTGRLLGTYRSGDDFLYDLSSGDPAVLSIEPAPPGAQPERNVPLLDAAQVVPVNAFLSFVSVTNVVGMTQANAGAALVAGGYVVGGVSTATSATVAAGMVLSQSPAAGALAVAGASVALVVSRGTVAQAQYWRFDDGIGTNAANQTPGGNPGTLEGSPTWITSGLPSNLTSTAALDFDPGDLVDGGNINLTSTSGGGGVTVALWLRPDSLDGDVRFIGQLSGAVTQAGAVGTGQGLGTGALWVWDGAAFRRLSNAGALSTGSWQHLALVWDRGQVTAYLNGVKQLSATANFDFGVANGRFGIAAKFLRTYGDGFDGQIDDVALFDAALSAQEVLGLSLQSPQSLITLTTADGRGADAAVLGETSAGSVNYGGNALLKAQDYTAESSWLSFLRFDLSGHAPGLFSNAVLRLTSADEGYGAAGSTFQIHGLKDSENADNWGETAITYTNAPGLAFVGLGSADVAPARTELLGTAVQTMSGVSVCFSNSALVAFLNADSDGLVTFILSGNGVATGMALQWGSKEHAILTPPLLQFEIAGVPNTFSEWISRFEVGGLTGFSEDPDGDGLSNGMEAWFGTDPGQRSNGLAGLATDGVTTRFTHPKNDAPPRDLMVFYTWSPTLFDWYLGDGIDGPAGGPTVTISPVTADGTTTVTVTTSERLEKLFLRVSVQNSAL